MKKFTFILTVLIATAVAANAQWQQTSGPEGGSVLSLAISGTNIFAGTYGGGVFLSSNNGGSWNLVNTGLTNTAVHSLAMIGTNIFAGTFGLGVFLSTNNGNSWAAVNNGLTNSWVRQIGRAHV